MKKFYMIAAALLLGLGAQAKGFEVFYGDNLPVKNGDVIEWNDMKITDDYGDDGFMYAFDPELYLLSDADGAVNVVATCTSGQSIQLCCGGNCMMGKKVTRENVSVTANTKLPFQFEQADFAESKDDVPQGVTTTISVEFSDDPSSAIEFTVVFNKDNAGVEGVAIDSNSAMSVYSLDGRSAGTSLQGLAKGVYVVRQNGKTSKVLVK